MPKFIVTFKTPDAVADCIQGTVARYAVHEAPPGEFDEVAERVDELTKQLKNFAAKWVQYGELVHIEFDTDTGTATVLPTGR
jgi:hypothetical protein